ncbi:hypothetical protein CEXT_759271 [Caerostris extrusa]|uniref:FACT complex subunit SSRP1 n=1 Tax=Caerostris extrusa TaxID=172846 RepID=A0AAV4UKC8_CAEEX|nr:hypothetical protein CEXT_759271 [Caerostris extrusa]
MGQTWRSLQQKRCGETKEEVIYSFKLEGEGEGVGAEKDTNTGQDEVEFIRDLGKFSFVLNLRRKQFSLRFPFTITHKLSFTLGGERIQTLRFYSHQMSE